MSEAKGRRLVVYTSPDWGGFRFGGDCVVHVDRNSVPGALRVRAGDYEVAVFVAGSWLAYEYIFVSKDKPKRRWPWSWLEALL